jgi:hypothetical protein
MAVVGLTAVGQPSIFLWRTAMSKTLSLFLDRLAERFAALLAGAMSSRVEGLHAVVQADQQSQLEDLARRYEADGKPEIAATLRLRAARLTSTDLAGQAVELVERLTQEPGRLPGSVLSQPPAGVPGLPDFSNTPLKGEKRRRKALGTSENPTDTGDIA